MLVHVFPGRRCVAVARYACFPSLSCRRLYNLPVWHGNKYKIDSDLRWIGQFELDFFYPSYRKRKNVTRNAKIFQHGAVCGASLIVPFVWLLGISIFLAHLAKGHEILCHGAASVIRPSGVNFFLWTTSQEPQGQFQPNLVGNMLGGWRFRFVQMKGLVPFWGPVRGRIRKILINLQKSSHEPLTGMHWYLAWNILGARRFKFVQMKSLGSCMSPLQGLKLLQGDI